MPIYEYTCQDCAEHFEQFVRSMTAVAEAKCPNCGGTNAKKGWSLFGTSSLGVGLGRASEAASACSPAGT